VNERKPQRAVVIGGGFIGLEMAEAFHHRGMHVTIVERNPHILPLLDRDMATHLQNQIRRADFDFKPNANAPKFTARRRGICRRQQTSGGFDSVERRREGRSGTGQSPPALEIGVTGGVKTNGRMESSDPDIYAVGDAAETMHALTGARARIALAGPANRQGALPARMPPARK
jgi:NADPH-dependent 2,4-dienoyl-CoA reductase/sulfur reductase-like enzyme